jgi:hypothetical protein
MMLRAASVGALGALIALLSAAGCARRPSAQEPTARPLVVTKEGTPLPEWAPAHPSPEFLRAAKLLKPMPADLQQQGSQVEAALYQRMTKTYPAVFELFGSLGDRQIEQLQSAGRCLLPVKSMPARQRTALDAYFRAFREAFRGFSQSSEGIPAWTEDLATILYKAGAREDLSNVDLLFTLQARTVNINFEVAMPDGKRTHAFGSTIATM